MNRRATLIGLGIALPLILIGVLLWRTRAAATPASKG